jgi:hypothetical protein
MRMPLNKNGGHKLSTRRTREDFWKNQDFMGVPCCGYCGWIFTIFAVCAGQRIRANARLGRAEVDQAGRLKAFQTACFNIAAYLFCIKKHAL